MYDTTTELQLLLLYLNAKLVTVRENHREGNRSLAQIAIGNIRHRTRSTNTTNPRKREIERFSHN